MPYMKWEDKISVGIAEMDAQHKKLIELVNTLHEARIGGAAHERVGEILDGITVYVRTHFTDEETLMQKHTFPGLEEHQQEHISLIKKLAAFKHRYQEDNPPTSFELLSFLKSWIVDHIMESDRVYGNYIQKKLEVIIQDTPTAP